MVRGTDCFPVTQLQSLSQHRGLRAGWEAQGQAGTLLNYFLQGVYTRVLGHIKVPSYSLLGAQDPLPKPGIKRHPARQPSACPYLSWLSPPNLLWVSETRHVPLGWPETETLHA